MGTRTFLILTTLLLAHQSNALECGDSIFTDTVLTNDLHCTSGYYALEIMADNVTLDMNGYTISGTHDLAGIIVDGQDKVIINGNGSIKGFWVGVNSSESNQLEVKNTTFYDLINGVIISSGNDANIANNSFIYMDSTGVSISNVLEGFSASNNSVINNEFYKNNVGIAVCGDESDYNTLKSNFIWKTQNYGINIIQSDVNNIIDNDVIASGNVAIRLNNSSYNMISSNSLSEGRVGLAIYANIDDSCLNTGSSKSFKNDFTYNHSIDFDTGIVVGSGNSKAGNVLGNQLNYNKLYNDDIGIFFNTDAHFNNAGDNAYFGTLTDISDIGFDNLY